MALNVQPEIRQMSLAGIIPAPCNPREIDEPALAGLQTSIEKFGLVQLLIVNRRTGHLVAG